MKKLLSLASVASLMVGVTLAVPSKVHADPTGGCYNTTVGPAPMPMAMGTFAWTDWSAATTAGGNIVCLIGDKTYSMFDYSSGPWAATNTTFSLNNATILGIEYHTISAAGSYMNGSTYGYSYKIAVDPANEYYIADFASATNTSISMGTNEGTKMLSANVMPLAGEVGSGDCVVSGTDYKVTAAFGPGYGAQSASSLTCDHELGKTFTYVGSMEVMQGATTNFSDTISQEKVPGPLSILGAGAAFGFSRKLRNRIKLVG